MIIIIINDVVVIRKLFMSPHAKVKNLSPTSAGPKQNFPLHATSHHNN